MVEVGSEIHFTPWVALIDDYLAAAEASLLECMSQASAEPSANAGAASVVAGADSEGDGGAKPLTEKNKAFLKAKHLVSDRKLKFRDVESDKDDYVTTIESKSNSTQRHWYPSNADGKPPEMPCTGFREGVNAFNNMQSVFCNEAGQVDLVKVAIWKETAKKNMVFILNYLCKHYSRHLKDRVFLNCVVYKYNLANKSKKSRLSNKASPYMGSFRQGAAVVATGTPPQQKARAQDSARSAQRAKRQMLPNSKNTDALNRFISTYLDEHRIDLEEEDELQRVLNGDRTVLDQWRKKMAEKKEKRKDPKRAKKTGDSAAAAASVSSDNNMDTTGGKRKINKKKTKRKKKRKKKTKRKIKRKKKTKRKKRRKRKKKTKKKR